MLIWDLSIYQHNREFVRFIFELSSIEIDSGIKKMDGKTLPQWGAPMVEIKEYANVAAIKSYLAKQNKQETKQIENNNDGKGRIKKTIDKVKDWWHKKGNGKRNQKCVDGKTLPEAA